MAQTLDIKSLRRRHFMGAKTWMLVYCAGSAVDILKSEPELDRDASLALARKLFPAEHLEPLEDGNLAFTNPINDELLIGYFPGVTVIAAGEFGIDHPSKLPERYLEAAPNQTVYLHAMHSVVDWFAFAVWRGGRLERSLSLSPDSGILENIGQALAFEKPFWEGKHPATDPGEDAEEYPFAFHPLELGEAALLEFFGYQLEGIFDPSFLDPEAIPLCRFKRTRTTTVKPFPPVHPWWKFW
jgi:hypothetical protein